MDDSNRIDVHRINQRIGEIESLMAQWKDARDPESLWMLALLRGAVDTLRADLERNIRN